MTSLKQIQMDIGTWADEKIPLRTPSGQMKHLEKELDELKAEMATNDMEKAREELADVLIVALNIAYQLGFDMEYEVERKMAINKNRQWSAPDADGVIHHL